MSMSKEEIVDLVKKRKLAYKKMMISIKEDVDILFELETENQLSYYQKDLMRQLLSDVETFSLKMSILDRKIKDLNGEL